jgi:hypothetical protein
MSSFAENGLNFGCCVGDSLASAAERMANARVEASMNIRKGMGEASMTGSAEESLHAADLTNCTVGDDGTTVRGEDGIPPSNSTVGNDGTVLGGYDIPPSNTPPSKKHAHHKGGSPMSSFAENGLTNFGCCVGDSLASAAERMANARVEASMNIRKGMIEGMVTVGVCMVVCSLLGRSLLGSKKE